MSLATDLILSLENPVRPLERITRVTPLGLRFWDGITGTFVTDGLSVVAYPSDTPAARVTASQNRSGVYLFSRINAAGIGKWRRRRRVLGRPASDAKGDHRGG